MPAGETIRIVNEIATHIQSSLPGWYGRNARFVNVPQLHARKWSFFIRYEIRRSEGSSVNLLVKVPRLENTHTLAQAAGATDLVPYTRLEYEALVTLAATFEREATHAFGAIRPMAFLPEWNAIVMEELRLQPIKWLLFKPGLLLGRNQDWSHFECILAQAGHWLRIFHGQMGPLPVEPLELSLLQSEASAALQELDQATGNRMDLKRLETTLCGLARSVANVSVPVANLHGDLSCGNIFTTPDRRVGVLDPHGNMRGPIYQDLASLLNDPFTRIPLVLIHRLPFMRERFDECAGAVLQAYFGFQPYQARVLDLYSALVLIRKWTQDERTFAASRGLKKVAARVVAPAVRHFFWSNLQYYLGRAAIKPVTQKTTRVEDGNETRCSKI